MATKNIEININNGNGYDTLYPKTVMANITDWQNNVYSKSQTYSRSEVYNISQIQSNYYNKTSIDNMLKNSSGWVNEGSYNFSGRNGTVSQISKDGGNMLLKDTIICLDYVTGSITPTNASKDCYVKVDFGITSLEIFRVFNNRNGGSYNFLDWRSGSYRPFQRITPINSGCFNTDLSKKDTMQMAIGIDKSSPSTWANITITTIDQEIEFSISNIKSSSSVRWGVTIYTNSLPVKP